MGTPVRRWNLENGNMFSKRAEMWGQRKKQRAQEPHSSAPPLVTVAEPADRRTVEACLGGGGGGTRDPRRRSRAAGNLAAPLLTLKRVCSQRAKAKRGLSECLSAQPRAAAAGKKARCSRGSTQTARCEVVASLGSLGASTWEGKGHPAPEMLVIACNGC
jgi:hypothetical protein